MIPIKQTRPQISLSSLQALASTPAGLAWIASRDNQPEWHYAPHIQLLNKALLDVASRRIRRLMVFMPPGHAKSSMVSEAFPAWYLCTHPDKSVILSTYAQEFSETWGRKARDLVLNYGPDIYGVRVRDDSSAVSQWRIAGHRGVMYSVGVGGQVTGKRADMFIADDPIKNAEEAESQVYRDRLERWFNTVATTRLTPTGCVVLCMTRWHHDDLAGRLLDRMQKGGNPWHVISLPALAEESPTPDPLGRAQGEALWPSMYSLPILEEKRKDLSDQQWLSLYQQRPTPESGAMYKREWMNNRYREDPKYSATIMAIDSAFKDGTGSDYTAIEIWSATATDYYVRFVLNVRLEYPELIQTIKDMAAEWKVDAIYIEDKASGQSAAQTLRRETRLPIIAVAPKGSKVLRADGNTPTWRAGKVWLPEQAEWLSSFIEQHIAFPRGSHDDMVDAGNIALDQLKYGGVEYLEESVLSMQAPHSEMAYLEAIGYGQFLDR